MKIDIKKIKQANLKLILVEPLNKEILLLTKKITSKKIAQIILIGNKNEIESYANINNIKINFNKVKIIDHLNDQKINEKIKILHEIRKNKNTLEECKEFIKCPIYYASVLLYLNEADASLGGVIFESKKIIKPPLQILRNNKRASSHFILTKKEDKIIMSDCALNIDPSSEDLIEITNGAIEMALLFKIVPRIAFLSYTSKSDTLNPENEKILLAIKELRRIYTDLEIDGEFQFDSAFNEAIRFKKVKESNLIGKPTIYIFPNVTSGNIAYKIFNHVGKYRAYGPIIYGLSKPCNDVSRGANLKEIYKMALITLLQACCNDR